jgi:hypothetical protein
MAGAACTHIEAITTVKRPKRPRVRRLREKRLIVGSSANMSTVRRDTLLR